MTEAELEELYDKANAKLREATPGAPATAWAAGEDGAQSLRIVFAIRDAEGVISFDELTVAKDSWNPVAFDEQIDRQSLDGAIPS